MIYEINDYHVNVNPKSLKGLFFTHIVSKSYVHDKEFVRIVGNKMIKVPIFI